MPQITPLESFALHVICTSLAYHLHVTCTRSFEDFIAIQIFLERSPRSGNSLDITMRDFMPSLVLHKGLLFFYPSYCQMHAYPRKYAASEFWMVDPKTHQFWVWRCVALLYQALDTIRMENRLVGGLNIPSLAVDDTQRLFYSGKKKTHTIMYEIAVDVCTGFIHHVWGGYPGSDNDLSMISASGLLEELFEGEKLLGDKIYRHLDQIVTPTAGKWYTLNAAEQTFNSYVSSRREIVEHVFGRMKQFHCLQEKWRHSLPQHLAVFTVIANIINVDKKLSQL
ncbi:DDE domain transposase [Planoprotostelium fungivorum]|uniref:DDE domain transposase n=1 Tax=Planoprotostelium fungivorum TaxID=1890364 RepID=A0A2P6N653_9EUKA|nr:DDE domain transposase [Planoprotostelium fungivorum]